MTPHQEDQCPLLPCPFCGGKARIEPKNWAGRDWIGVFCLECGLFHDSREPDDAKAIAAWNRRADITAARQGRGGDEAKRSEPDAWQKPEIEQDDGEICVRAFTADNTRCVSFSIRRDKVVLCDSAIGKPASGEIIPHDQFASPAPSLPGDDRSQT